MSLEQFISEALSPWMKKDGPDSDIVLSSRIRLARNIEEYKFPILATMEESYAVIKHVGEALTVSPYERLAHLKCFM
ncbi:ATP:guanido phosphotransferase YacI [Halalkalibacter hemicellulosilyticusJCM 9152]|uniref:ATP:guanido phosphotransferase YacI n=1 Tax=Halalkalibacter hemicellulosilyticusJCM 9152 TaxID=1236971 RepID=W4QJG1_9BACI|nr:ATP:guanido phosphotransferase YacI [Halalkalibacter hemicellulosilyticusJCM 9152]